MEKKTKPRYDYSITIENTQFYLSTITKKNIELMKSHNIDNIRGYLKRLLETTFLYGEKLTVNDYKTKVLVELCNHEIFSRREYVNYLIEEDLS